MKIEVKEEDDVAEVAAVKAEIDAIEAEIAAVKAEGALGGDTPPLDADDAGAGDSDSDVAAGDDKVSYYANIHKFIYSYIHTHVSL